MAYQAVVFDLFDTLVDLYMERLPLVEFGGHKLPASAIKTFETVPASAGLEFEHFAATLGQVDREFRESRYAKHLELPTLERFSVLCERLELARRIGDRASDVPHAMVDVHMAMLRDCAAVPDHHAEVLARLRSRVRIGLCSNFSHTPTALAIMEQYGLREHFDCLIVSEDVGIRKPRPEIFQAALRALDVAPGAALHVGDNLDADVAGGAAIGLRTVWITRRVADPDAKLGAYGGPPPSFRIHDLAEILEVIESESGRG